MPEPRLYLDECTSHQIIPALRERGLFVTTAQAEGQRFRDDEEQIEFAAARGYVIVSTNQRHFRRWHQIYQEQGREHGGIILVPDTRGLSRPTEDRLLLIRVLMLLDWIEHERVHWHNRLIRWTELQLALQTGYRLPGYGDEDVRFALGQIP